MSDKKAEFSEGAALVAGGTGGIGSAVCLALAEAGSNVVLTFRSNESAAQALVKKIEKAGCSALALPLDLEDSEATKEMAAKAIETFGHLHSVVYAAGPPIEYLYINEITSKEWSRVINADVNGCFNLIEATLPHFRERKAGAYVSIITAAVDHAPPRDILSAAPKVAIEMLTKGVAREEGRNGIRANCVGPGLIAAGLGITTEHEHTKDYIGRMVKAIPLKRAGEAEEVANSVMFLLSQKASYVTGTTIPVAGGLQLV